MYYYTPSENPVVLFVLTRKVMCGHSIHPETLVTLADVHVFHVDDVDEGRGPHDELQGPRGHEVTPPRAVRPEVRQRVLFLRDPEFKLEITEDFAVMKSVTAAHDAK